jgi:Fe-S cluster biogenesis protein NfuA
LPSKEDLVARVEKVLVDIRELLGKDGGTVSLVEVTQDRIVQVHLSGTCATCRPAELPTLRAGIERLMKSEVPEVERVEAV